MLFLSAAIELERLWTAGVNRQWETRNDSQRTFLIAHKVLLSLLSGSCKGKDQAKDLIESANFKDNQIAKGGPLCWGQYYDWENLVFNACIVKFGEVSEINPYGCYYYNYY